MRSRIGPRERWIWISLLTGAIAFHFFSPTVPVRADEAGTNQKYQQILESVIYYAKNLYVDPIDEKQLLIGAIRGVLAATGDPYTRFLDREEHAEFNDTEEGQKVGIGVEVTIRNGYPVVIAPLEGSPADRAGVKAGDRILSVDGNSAEKKSFGDLLKLISGEPGSVVELEVERSGRSAPLTFRITRGVFHLEYVKSTYFPESQIGYIRLTHFFGEDSGSVENFRRHLVELRDKKAKGIIIDLRNNPGGHLNMAVTLAGYFLKPGEVVVQAIGRDASQNKTFVTSGETGIVPDSVHIAILINHGSASASEILSGALQDHGRAVLVGTRSFGKASVQQVVRPLPDDTAALITIQRYYTPKMRSIQGVGLSPDVPVDEIRPTADESYYLHKMDDAGFLDAFVRENPVYSDRLEALFQKSAASHGWKLSGDLVLFLLKQRYGAIQAIADPSVDPQLRKAIGVLAK